MPLLLNFDLALACIVNCVAELQEARPLIYGKLDSFDLPEWELTRQHSVDLPQGGLEVPCTLTFVRPSMEMKKVRKLVGLAPDTTSSKNKETKDSQPCQRETSCIQEMCGVRVISFYYNIYVCT